VTLTSSPMAVQSPTRDSHSGDNCHNDQHTWRDEPGSDRAFAPLATHRSTRYTPHNRKAHGRTSTAIANKHLVLGVMPDALESFFFFFSLLPRRGRESTESALP